MNESFADATRMLSVTFKDDPNWIAMRKNLCPRRYQSPEGYLSHAAAMDSLATLLMCFTLEGRSQDPEQPVDFSMANLYAACCGLPPVKGRSYWINKDLATSFANTDLPDDLTLGCLNIPLGTFILFIPVEVFAPGFLIVSYGEPESYQFPGTFPQPGKQKVGFPLITFKNPEDAERAIRCGTLWKDTPFGTRWKSTDPMASMLPSDGVEGAPEDLAIFKTMASIAVNALVWMNSHHESVGVTEGKPIGKPGGKSVFSWSPTWLGAGYKVRRAVGVTESDGGPKMPSHWRRGHLRGVWYGPRTETSPGTGQRVRWIEPVWVNPDVV